MATARTICVLLAGPLLLAACGGGQPRPTTPPDIVRGTPPALVTVSFSEATNLSFDVLPDGRGFVLSMLGQLWHIPAGGGDAVAWTDALGDTTVALHPRVSPDGQTVVIARSPYARSLALFSPKSARVASVQPPNPEAKPGEGVWPDRVVWSPDGSVLWAVASRNPEPRVWQQVFRRIDPVTWQGQDVPVEGMSGDEILGAMTVSPDGARIAVVVGWYDSEIWEVDLGAGSAAPVGATGQRPRGLAYSPDGERLAYFADDSVGRHEIRIHTLGTGRSTTLHVFPDTAVLPGHVHQVRLVWTEEDEVVFDRDGRIWRMDTRDGRIEEVPFLAEVSLPETPAPPKVTLAQPGQRRFARGFTGLALSADGARYAFLAFDTLWVGEVGGGVTALRKVSPSTDGVSWSPDGRYVAWAGGVRGAEDLYRTDVTSGVTDRLTDWPGRERAPQWSPDGRHIAVLHSEPGEVGSSGRLRLIPVAEARADPFSLEAAVDLGLVQRPDWGATNLPQWTADGGELLVPEPGENTGELVRLDGTRRKVALPASAAFPRLTRADTLVYIEGNLLRMAVRTDSVWRPVTDPISFTTALYPTVARDGSILFACSTGFCLRRASGEETSLGWPVAYRVPVPAPLYIANVRLITGGRRGPGAPVDLIVERGVITAIAPAGEGTAPPGARTLDGDGRVAIPGLIDSHAHLAWHDEATLRALLYRGITTVRDLGSEIARSADLRDEALAAPDPASPRILLGGFYYFPGCHSAACLTTAWMQYSRSPEEALRGLELSKRFGADYAKLYGVERTESGTWFVQAAHGAGLPVTADHRLDLPLLAAGLKHQEHAVDQGTPDLRLDRVLLMKAHGVSVVPTLAAIPWRIDVVEDSARWKLGSEEVTAFLSPFTAPRIPSRGLPPRAVALRRGLQHQSRKAVALLHQQGVTLGMGTDALILPFLAPQYELEELVKAGLSPLEAIHAATAGSARALGLQGVLGTLEVGAVADLVILERDPTSDITAVEEVWHVVHGGRVVDRASLLRP